MEANLPHCPLHEVTSDVGGSHSTFNGPCETYVVLKDEKDTVTTRNAGWSTEIIISVVFALPLTPFLLINRWLEFQ